MRTIRMILAFFLNWIIITFLFKVTTYGVGLLIPNLTGSEKDPFLVAAYGIGAIVGMLILVISLPISKIIYHYAWNWKKKRTVRLTFDDGGDVEESLSDGRGREELD